MTLQITNVDNSNKNVSELKKILLGVQELTEVEKRYSLNALKIFKERYLLKDDAGNTVERLHQLFKRVAMGVGIMEVLYDEQWYRREENSYPVYGPKVRFHEERLKAQEMYYKDFDYKNINNIEGADCYYWGDGYYLNAFHYERLLARHVELMKEGRIGVDFGRIQTFLQHPELYPEFKEKYFPRIKMYYDLMAEQYFLPNTPALMNVGTKLGMNAACFTLDMEDDLDDIYQTYADIAKIFKAGGGIGINYSKLRAEGAYVRGTGGKSSGTLSWLKGTDETTGRVAQGGKRRGASMGILNIDHPEIDRFIDLKKDNKTLLNHNISVNTTNEFFEDMWDLSDDTPTHLKALAMMDKIAKNAWISGDPGMVFEDNMNANNLLEPVLNRKIDVTNPCSEISMYPYESCILASINLNKFVVGKGKFNFNHFSEIVETVTQFLDSLIDATKYPLEKINDMTKKCRRIGVGFMGIADALVKMGVKYNTEEGFRFIADISMEMTKWSLVKSELLAKQKGAFPLWYDDKYPKNKLPTIIPMNPIWKSGLRNCSTTTIAPTGTLSMFCDISSGIEPIFSKNFTKNVTLGEFEYGNEDSEHMVTAMEMHPFDHIMAQAVAQRWITNGISKTINLPNDCSSKMIEYCYVLSWALGNKGISVYRDGCKEKQVLNDIKKTSIRNINPISDYTIQIIKELNNIPENYKEEMVSRLNEIVDMPYSKKEEEMVFNNVTEMTLKCPNCEHGNHLVKNGRGDLCFMCSKCGHQLGSCS